MNILRQWEEEKKNIFKNITTFTELSGFTILSITLFMHTTL